MTNTRLVLWVTVTLIAFILLVGLLDRAFA